LVAPWSAMSRDPASVVSVFQSAKCTVNLVGDHAISYRSLAIVISGYTDCVAPLTTFSPGV